MNMHIHRRTQQTKQMNTTNEIIKAAVKTPILLRRTLEAMSPEILSAFSVEFMLQVKVMKDAHINAGSKKTCRPNNARECENLLKRTMRLP